MTKNETVEWNLTGKDNTFAGAYDTQKRINTQHCTPTKKYVHHDSHAAEDGDSGDKDDGKTKKIKDYTVQWHLTSKDNTFAGAYDTWAPFVTPSPQM